LDAATLKKIPLFAEVPDEVLGKVAPWATVEEWPEGKVIVKEGGFSNHFYAIQDGTVKVEREGQHMVVTGTGELVNAVILALYAAGVTARDVQLDSSNLEDAFVKLTGKNLDKEGALA